ncbi:hypothetical protein [Methylobacterium radiotolerans]|uniref:hypothetical protein n=1 Tax=Methylobacterium radiotolerans TaxID=31998 RepID=UPI000D5DB6B1|nr:MULTISPECIES: hypothetical protein [Methylobacterium]MDE3745103.1 hypothetical protein [Methylobacterium radiotolerans]PVY95456.1 hypothetical protein C7388_12483 [Methylobacterium organophilum]
MEQFLRDRRIGVSVSNSNNLAALGLANEHVEDDLVEMTRYLVAAGATVVYGGDLRRSGFTGLLLEFIARHQPRGDESIRFENFLAWPVHATMPFDELVNTKRLFEPVGKLILLAEDGTELSLDKRRGFDRVDVAENVWAPALTAMRVALAFHCDARIVAGGATRDFKGAMPGIAEETILSLEAGKPTFVTGALGGCALDIGLRCGLAKAPVSISTNWPGLEQFTGVSPRLNPGLKPDEASALASNILGTEMLILLLKGLHASFPTTKGRSEHSGFKAAGPT